MAEVLTRDEIGRIFGCLDPNLTSGAGDYAFMMLLLYSGSMIKTEVSGYPVYKISYHGSNAGSDVEGRFILIAGSTVMVIITYVTPSEKWDHLGPIYDRTKSNIYLAAEKDADNQRKITNYLTSTNLLVTLTTKPKFCKTKIFKGIFSFLIAIIIRTIILMFFP